MLKDSSVVLFPKVVYSVDDQAIELPFAILRKESLRLLPPLFNAGDVAQIRLLRREKLSQTRTMFQISYSFLD
jgi:transposase